MMTMSKTKNTRGEEKKTGKDEIGKEKNAKLPKKKKTLKKMMMNRKTKNNERKKRRHEKENIKKLN